MPNDSRMTAPPSSTQQKLHYSALSVCIYVSLSKKGYNEIFLNLFLNYCATLPRTSEVISLFCLLDIILNISSTHSSKNNNNIATFVMTYVMCSLWYSHKISQWVSAELETKVQSGRHIGILIALRRLLKEKCISKMAINIPIQITKRIQMNPEADERPSAQLCKSFFLSFISKFPAYPPL